MFEKLLKKFRKGNETETLEQVSSAENIPNQEISEGSQLFEDTIESFEGNSHIDLGGEVVAKMEAEIREEFDSEFSASPDDIDLCLEELDDIKDELTAGLFLQYRDKDLIAAGMRIIDQVLEEKLVSLGSSIDAYYEWVENDTDEEEMEPTEVHYTR